jgi:disulfide bond formation protein DsbB
MIHAGVPQSDGVLPPRGGISVWTWTAFALAVLALAGSLWLSIGMHLKACPLCLYQRTFVMGVVGVLAMGLLTGARRAEVLELAGLPLATAGLAVAVFHEYLELTGKLECPKGLLNLGSAPQQSLAAILVLVILLLGAIRNKVGAIFALSAIVLGVLFAIGAVASAPPMSPASKPYETPLDVCRPPYHPQ